jgi:heme A synthase
VIALHDRFATSIILYMIVVGLWGVVSYIRKIGVSPSYRGTLVIGEAILVLQGILGISLVASGYRPKQPLHFLYGGLSVFILPFLMSFARVRPSHQRPLIYGLGAIFIVGLALRAMMTGS